MHFSRPIGPLLCTSFHYTCSPCEGRTQGRHPNQRQPCCAQKLLWAKVWSAKIHHFYGKVAHSACTVPVIGVPLRDRCHNHPKPKLPVHRSKIAFENRTAMQNSYSIGLVKFGLGFVIKYAKAQRNSFAEHT